MMRQTTTNKRALYINRNYSIRYYCNHIVTGAMKLQDKNRDMAIYIQKRGNSELDNSLFLTSDIAKLTNQVKVLMIY